MHTRRFANKPPPVATTEVHRPPLWFVPLPILKGPLQGAWWLPASGGKLPRILLSSYEPEQTALFQHHLRPGDVVLDVGAATGYYTLLASRLVGERGQVVAFEPDPRNVFFLRQHVRLNRAKNVRVHEQAVANSNGWARFGGGTGSGTRHLDPGGEWEVPIVRLDDVFQRSLIRPTHMKIDVEGAERDVLLGAQRLLQRCRPMLFLSTHNDEVHADCCKLLADLGYCLQPILGDNLATTTEVLCLAGRRPAGLSAYRRAA